MASAKLNPCAPQRTIATFRPVMPTLPNFLVFCLTSRAGGLSPDATKKVLIEDLDPFRQMGGMPQPGPGVTRPYRYKVSLLDLKTGQDQGLVVHRQVH